MVKLTTTEIGIRIRAVAFNHYLLINNYDQWNWWHPTTFPSHILYKPPEDTVFASYLIITQLGNRSL
jgi:hypothetical protein